MFEFKEFKKELIIKGFSKETIKDYLYWNKRFICFANKSPKEVSRSDIKGFILFLYEKKGLRERTINKVIASLKAYYDGFLHRRLFSRIRYMKNPKTLTKILSKDDIKKMICSTTNIKHKLLIEILYGSGLRVSEAIKLRISDINIKEGFVYIKNGKGKKDRIVLLSKRFINDFINFMSIRNKFGIESDYIFYSNIDHSRHITRRTAKQIIKRAGRKAGVMHIYPHLLRASFATHLIEEKNELVHVQKLLGHSSIRTTRNYIRLGSSYINEIKNPLDSIFRD